MKHSSSRRRTFAIALLMGTAGFAAKSLAADRGPSADAAPTSPPGITLVDVTLFIANSSEQFLWRRLGDANGRPLYTFDADGTAGASTCDAACTREFPPYLAAKGAKPDGEWSLVQRSDGTRQWAYQGRPLYRYSGQDPAGQPRGSNLSSSNPDWTNPASKLFSPKQGWRRASYAPENTVLMPGEVELKSLGVANGYGFVDADSGLIAYALPTRPKNPAAWRPVAAPAAGVPLGDFTIVKDETGNRQWAYRGAALYTYREDYADTDLHGLAVEKDARPALVYRNFMPAGVGIGMFDLRGPLMTTDKGFTLYTQTRYHLQYGGRRARGGFRYLYDDAKGVGTRGCVGECTKFYKPLAAPKDAQSSGFWEVLTREDGTKQWAFKGSALYTYTGDKKPGDIEGNNRHDIVYGDPDGTIDLSATGGDIADGRQSTGSGYYWHTAVLLNY
jgi:predicted lipoprotein with Yx(FWY)xxD motif